MANISTMQKVKQIIKRKIYAGENAKSSTIFHEINKDATLTLDKKRSALSKYKLETQKKRNAETAWLEKDLVEMPQKMSRLSLNPQ